MQIIILKSKTVKSLLIFLFVFHSAFFLQATHLPIVSNKNLHSLLNGPCNVVANFTPGNDSILSSNTYPRAILFTSTSVNAMSIIWYMNGIYMGEANILNLGFSIPGTYEIKLIATNGSCSDTAVSYIIYAGTQPVNRNNIKAYYGFPAIDEKSNAMISTYDNGYLIGGETQLRGQQPRTSHYHGSDGFLQKIDESGCIKWTRLIESKYNGSISKIIQLKDSNYAVLGKVDDVAYLRKFDRQGNLIWNRNFSYELGNVNITIGSETEDGGFVLGGYSGFTAGIMILRTDSKGNMLWNKFYKLTNGFDVDYGVLGILQKGDAIYVCSYVVWVVAYPNVSIFSFNNLIKLNDTNGTTQWTKTYTINGSYNVPHEILSIKNGLLLNCTGTIGAQNNFIELNTNGDILASRGISVKDDLSNTHTTSAKINDNGDIYILNNGTETLNLQPYSAAHTTFIILDKNYTPKWTKGVVRENFYYPAIGKNGSFVAAGDELGTTLAPYSSTSNKIQFIKLDTTGIDSINYFCNFSYYSTTVINTSAAVQSFNWTTDSSITVSLKDTGTRMESTVYSEARYVCPMEFIDSCSLLKISGSGEICNISGAYTYRLHKNKTCNEPVQWKIDSSVSIISKTDSSITVKFPTFGNYCISAFLPFACTPVTDSIQILVASKSPNLNIGADTSLCVGSKLQLNAGNGFFTYKWKDGSTAKTFTVNSPGMYWVQVSDSCDNIFVDTITVVYTSTKQIKAAGNRKKCNNDTLQLIAPTGFKNYTWSPKYNISDTSLPNVTVNPLADTSYYLKAEISPGCFAYDTVQINVLHSNKIYLGLDTGICAGNTLNVNAGIGFSKYLWNTGAVTQQISIANSGMYTVVATAANGCFSADTIRLITVYPLPLPELGKNNTICSGTSRILDAGAGFIKYLWNNGSSLRTLKVNSPGIYSVVITDGYNCSGTAQLEINKIVPIPVNFLPADTSICTYGTLTINCLHDYSHYLWSNNTLNSSITINSPGIFWLSVTDNNGCSNTDTIIINKKDCLQGIFVPTAFSPNNDGSNDLFKPLIFGNVLNYHFVIYNRFGQSVFASSELNKGWDGTIKGIPQNGNVFVWMCTYQLSGEAEITKKGTVILVR